MPGFRKSGHICKFGDCPSKGLLVEINLRVVNLAGILQYYVIVNFSDPDSLIREKVLSVNLANDEAVALLK